MTVLGGLGAVSTTEHSRQGIYDGMMARNCYGTTGARLYLEITANGHRMGVITTTQGPIKISGTIYGTAPIEYIALFNRSQELTRITPNPEQRNPNLIKIIWSGATHQDRGRFMKWDGGLEMTGGRITGATPLNIYTAKYGIDDWDEGHVNWRSVTLSLIHI